MALLIGTVISSVKCPEMPPPHDENKKAIKNKKDTIYIDPKDLSESITPDIDEGPFYFDELRKSKK